MLRIPHLLLLSPAIALAPLAQAQSAAKVPVAVAALRPARTLDIGIYRIAPAPGEPPLLVHLWSAARRNPDAGGTFHAAPGTFSGKVSVAEVQSFDSLYLSPFVYDIFQSNGTGGWKYLSSFIANETSAPSAPTVRYLNNQTKRGYIFQIGQFGGQYISPSTIYIFPDAQEPGASYFTRDMTRVSQPANVGQRSSGFGRDARGYAQIIESRTDWDETTHKPVTARTVFNWNSQTNNWTAGRPIVVKKQGATEPQQ